MSQFKKTSNDTSEVNGILLSLKHFSAVCYVILLISIPFNIDDAIKISWINVTLAKQVEKYFEYSIQESCKFF